MRRIILITLTALILKAIPLQAEIYSNGLNPDFFTSDFMIGDAIVAVVFLESNGAQDLNTENWSEERKGHVLSEIMTGLNWWTQQNSRSPLSFTLVNYTLSTKYEPISRPYYHEALWIPDALSNLGYSGSRFTASRNFINDLRSQHGTDWGFIIYVVDSLNDSNGKLADGFFAYAYLGGPFIVTTYDNASYGSSNMDVVVAHETGHIFHALDEYAGGSSPYDYSHGYFPTVNGNHAWSSTANNSNSIMRGGIRWGISDWSRLMVGWRDSNSNNVDDIVDQEPIINVLQGPITLASNQQGFTGQAEVQVIPRQSNSNGYGLTLDSIAKVEYKLSSDDWADANPSDGAFNSGEENFQIEVTAAQMDAIGSQSITAQNLQVRARTAFSMGSNGSSGGGGGSSGSLAASISDSHPYPNPLKPSAQGINSITFTGLTANAKIQIFTPVGEPVFEATTNAAGANVAWNAKDSDGDQVASGVYLYYITDPQGGEKKGKLAILR